MENDPYGQEPREADSPRPSGQFFIGVGVALGLTILGIAVGWGAKVLAQALGWWP